MPRKNGPLIMNKLLALIPTSLLLFTGCDALLEPENFQNFACTVIPYYAADCGDPDVQADLANVLVNGAVKAQITCQGVALGAGGKFASIYYQASKLQDGGCFATVNVTGPGTGGFVSSQGTTLTPRSVGTADLCPVTSFHVPMLRSNTTVENGVVKVEGPFCTTATNQFCTMPVAGNCSGFNTDQF